MDKKKKRQTILLVFTAIAVCYGIYSMVVPGVRYKKAVPQIHTKELHAFAVQTTSELTTYMPLPFDIYVLSRAESKWDNNPFSWKAGFKSKNKTPEALMFNYTGFIESNNHIVAVINAMEYQSGEELEKEGFFVKKITPLYILIENKLENTKIKIPLLD